MILFPQLFWACSALLASNVEAEFLRAVQMLTRLVSRMNFEDENVNHVLLSKLPPEWTPSFLGIQPLLLKGIVGPTTEAASMELLSILCTIKCVFVAAWCWFLVC